MRPDWLQRALAIHDPLRRALYVTGLAGEELRAQGERLVVVGGTPVAWYTRGLYASADVDVLCPSGPLDGVLRAMGFEKEGRYWYRDDLRVVIEAPGTALEAYRDRTTEVEIEDVSVTLVSVEEAILDRLRACVHWRSELDCEQAYHMMALHRESIDGPYMERRASRDQVADKLAELRKRVQSLPD